MKSSALWAAAALTLTVTPVAAQQHQHQAQPAQTATASGMESCAGMTAGPMPAQVLQHRAHLALTAAQVASLEELSRAAAAALPKMHEAMLARDEIAKLLTVTNPDLPEYERRLRANSEHMVQAHVAIASVVASTRGVLTAEQQKQFQGMSPDVSNDACPMMKKAAQSNAGAGTHKH